MNDSKPSGLTIEATTVSTILDYFHPAIKVGDAVYYRKDLSLKREDDAFVYAQQLVSDAELFLKSSLAFWNYTQRDK